MLPVSATVRQHSEEGPPLGPILRTTDKGGSRKSAWPRSLADTAHAYQRASISNRTRTSTPRCATSGRPARVLGSRREAVPFATGTPGDRPALALLQESPRVRP